MPLMLILASSFKQIDWVCRLGCGYDSQLDFILFDKVTLFRYYEADVDHIAYIVCTYALVSNVYLYIYTYIYTYTYIAGKFKSFA